MRPPRAALIIHIEICDVCRRIQRGLPLETFSSSGSQWDVGACCEEKRFTVVKHTSVIKNHLLVRIEALIATELALMKEPQ